MKKNLYIIEPKTYSPDQYSFLKFILSEKMNDLDLENYYLILGTQDEFNELKIKLALTQTNQNILFHSSLTLVSLFKIIIFIRKTVQEKKVSCVHSLSPQLAFISFLSLLGLSCRNFISCFTESDPESVLLRLFKLDKIIFRSRFLKESFLNRPYFFEPTFGIETLPDYVEDVQFNESRVKELKNVLSENGKYTLIGTIGFISPSKYQDVLIKTAVKYRENRPLGEFNKMKFLIIGSPQETETDQLFYEYLKTLVREEGLENRVIFLPLEHERNLYLHVLDLYVHTNKKPIIFGDSILTAMKLKTLVAASRSGESGYYIQHEKNGFLYNGWSETAPGELYLILFKINTTGGFESSYTEKITSNSALEVSRQFSVANYSSTLLDLYKNSQSNS